MLLLSAAAPQSAAQSPGGQAFAQGRAHYEASEFELAVTRFEDAVSMDPGNSEYHHWLGRSYGRSAQRAPWYRAMRLARRTLEQFRKAVELDPGNVPAWEDLREYYRLAPAFLGGSRHRAEEIDRRLAGQEGVPAP